MVKRRYDIRLYGNGDLSALLTKLISSGTKITFLTVDAGIARFRTDKKGVGRIRRYRRRYGMKVKIANTGSETGAKGLFLSSRYFISLIIPFAGSFFLWTVNVESDVPEVTERIETKLEASSIVPLRPLALLPDEDEIRRNLMQDDPALSWVRFKRIGTSLTVIPMLSPPSSIITEEKGPPSDLIARTGGVISRFALTKGERVGHVHATVKKGDVLATGILEQGDKQTVVGAEGAVYADFWVEYSFSIPKIVTFKIQGEETVEFSLNIPWLRQKSSHSDEEGFSESNWRFLKMNRHVSEKDGQLHLTEGMEETVIVPLLKTKLLSESASSAIIKDEKVLHVTFDNDKVSGTILFLVNDNIAIKRPISQGD